MGPRLQTRRLELDRQMKPFALCVLLATRSMCERPFSTYKIRSEELVHCTRNGKLLSGVPLSSQVSPLIDTILIINAY